LIFGEATSTDDETATLHVGLDDLAVDGLTDEVVEVCRFWAELACRQNTLIPTLTSKPVSSAE